MLFFMKKANVVFWVTTGIIFLVEGVMTALAFQTDMAREGIRALGYPQYLGTMLAAFKVLGTLALIIPAVPARVKEWAYAGFGIDFIAALVSIVAVNGFNGTAVMPIVAMGLLVASYQSYHAMKRSKK